MATYNICHGYSQNNNIVHVKDEVSQFNFLHKFTFAGKMNSSSQYILLKSTRILPQPKNISQFVCKLLWNIFLSWAKVQIIFIEFKSTSEMFKPLKIKMHNQGIKYLIMAC